MKKIIIISLIFLTSMSFAQRGGHGGGKNYQHPGLEEREIGSQERSRRATSLTVKLESEVAGQLGVHGRGQYRGRGTDAIERGQAGLRA